MKNIFVLVCLFISCALFGQNILTKGGGKWSVLSEGFDGNVFVPAGWSSIVTNSSVTWERGNPEINFSTIHPESRASAIVNIALAGQTQNEWLVSPSFTVPENSVLSFYAYFNWDKLPNGGQGNPGATIQFKISENNGQSWTTIWDANNTPHFTGSQWKHRYVDLDSYYNKTVKFAWVVTGSDGGVFAVDGIDVNVHYDNDISIVPTLPMNGMFNFVQIPISQIESLNEKLAQYFNQITPELSFYQTRIMNNGNNVASNVKFTAKLNGNTIGTTAPINIESGIESPIVGLPALLNFVVGTNTIEYSITMDSTDQYQQDNYVMSKKYVTESLYAVDSVNSFDNGYNELNYAGNLFAIASKDHVVNSLEFAFSNSSVVGDKFKVSMFFYQTADNIFNGTQPVLSLPFFTYYIEKSSDMIGGFGEIKIPYLRFPQFGTYLIMIEPVDSDNLDLCYDESDVMIYSINNETVSTYSGYGALGCRMHINEIPTSSCNSVVTNMSETPNGNGEALLKWTSNATGYVINLSYSKNGETYSEDYVTTSNSLVCKNMIVGTEYSWSVTPFNTDGVSGTVYQCNNFIFIDGMDSQSNVISIYPNPATHFVIINGNNINAVDIYNITGNKVYAQNNVNGYDKINVESFTSGIYIVKLIDFNGGITVKKLIVK